MCLTKDEVSKVFIPSGDFPDLAAENADKSNRVDSYQIWL